MITPNPRRGNAHLVESLTRSLRSGKHGLEAVPGLLKRVLAEKSWREFVTQRGELVQHDRFAEFVTAPALRGPGRAEPTGPANPYDDPSPKEG